jgi:hypothetical protein
VSAGHDEQFAAAVMACIDEMNAVLPGLATRHGDVAVITALAENVGGALRILMHRGACTPKRARRIIQHIDRTAFAPNDGGGKYAVPPVRRTG